MILRPTQFVAWRALYGCISVVAWMLLLPSVQAGGGVLSLAGEWRFQLDPEDKGMAGNWKDGTLPDTIALPNTTATAGKGNPLTLQPSLDKASLVHLHQRFSYVGPAWYQKTVEVPASWREKDVRLFLERVIWETRVWINGKPVGAADSLTTPHRYDLTQYVKTGFNVLTVRVDNRRKCDIGIGHAYTDETQTIWNGLIGRIELESLEKVRVETLALRPDLVRGGVGLVLECVNNSGGSQEAELALSAMPANFKGQPGVPVKKGVVLPPGASTQTFFYPMPLGFHKWSEFSPDLYKMEVGLAAGSRRAVKSDTFGMREFKASGSSFTINGQPVFLRGTLECCIFPKTGHPDMTGAQWEKIFQTARSYGLNHLRFHSWCPPEIAFLTADRHGFYLQVELPNWSIKMGQVPEVDEFFRREGERMIREYGNHPSWVMLSLGNELSGDYGKLDELIAHFRKIDPDLLYTSTSFSFSPRGKLPGPRDDYFISQETQSGWVRGQGFLNSTKPGTDTDYSQGRSCLNIPLVSHEVGQYNVFPNLAELPKYDGALRCLGYEAIKADLEKKGRLADAARYTRDSGKLAALLYKEDIERALRTRGQSGIQLLDLHDFPGQSTATVGLLDSFWDTKGLVTPKEFCRFCAPTIPLIRMPQMVYQNNETFEAQIEIAHFGALPLENVTIVWKISDEEKLVAQGSFSKDRIPLGNGISLGRIQQSLSSVTKAAKLKVSVEIAGTEIGNDWSIWVYPEKARDEGDVAVFQTVGDPFYQALKDGRKVLLLPSRNAVAAPLDGRFIPVFWSPLHFPDQPGSLGATIEAGHPLWSEFPTSTHTDWQWWELLSRSFAVNMDTVSARLDMPLRFVDKYDRNALPAAIFEARAGAGKLLVCTLDIATDLDKRLAARQLRRSILAYMNSGRFQPGGELSLENLKLLFKTVRYVAKASSAQESYPVEYALDGDPKTFWHTDWKSGTNLPACFDLDLQKETMIRGFACLPRQDMDRGRISRYSVQVSVDGAQWVMCLKNGSFPNHTEKQTVVFDKPVKARFLRLIAESDHGNCGQAAIAEIEALEMPASQDVRDLGIVPGFNGKK